MMASRFNRDAVMKESILDNGLGPAENIILRDVGVGRKAHLLEDKQIPSVGVFDEVFSTWMAFGGNTQRGDGVAGIKRRRRDLSSDGVRKLTTASGRNRLISDLEDSIP
ncbi:hypothetical protein Tco_0226871 [Tanacetum coccineum]